MVSNSGEYYDPNNINDMSGTIKQLVTDETLRQHFIVAGREWIKAFSWEHSAAENLEVFRKVLA